VVTVENHEGRVFVCPEDGGNGQKNGKNNRE
jgi:hypothetical protein